MSITGRITVVGCNPLSKVCSPSPFPSDLASERKKGYIVKDSFFGSNH